VSFCDICGAKTDNLLVSEIEEAKMEVCQSCSKLGKVIGEKGIAKPKQDRKEITYVSVPEFGAIIRETRIGLDLRPDQFSRKLNEKESLIKKMEAEEIEPSLKFSDKFYDMFGKKLVEAYQKTHPSTKTKDHRGLTFGDVVKVKEN
jgi:putative transcription factor